MEFIYDIVKQDCIRINVLECYYFKIKFDTVPINLVEELLYVLINK